MKGWPLFLLLAGCAAGGADAGRLAALEDAQRAGDERLRAEIAELRNQRVRDAERLGDLERLAERMERDLALRRAEKDELREEIAARVRESIVPSDPRRGAVRVEVPRDAVADARRPAAEAGGPPAELYRKAYDGLIQENYGDAIAGFRAFLKAYPHHEFAGDAQFNLGEGYFALKDYGRALLEYSRVLQDHPNESRAPDALLGIARCREAMGEPERARETLRELIEKHPGSPAADKARRKLGS